MPATLGQPRQQRLTTAKRPLHRRQLRPFQHPPRNPPFAGGLELVFGGLAAAVLADQHVAVDALHQRAFVVEGEEAAGAWVRQHMRQFCL